MSVEVTYFVHGTTIDNETNKCTGWVGGELSELGIKQSKELINQIDGKWFDVIIASDLKRAVDSARLTWIDREILQDSRLRECNLGKKTLADESAVIYEEHIDIPFEDGECMKDVEKRISDLVKYLKENYDGKKVALVAHRAPQLAFEVIANNKNWEQALEEDWRKKKAWKPGWVYVV
ncbi:MAG: hypothetical protein A2Y24_01435 [Clostridiales bacterium GWE2_32_10]|nr:MAG: hypothetical protein A2Y24_01435 [Clostridiales bacterium GWE2_32_10]